MQITKCFFFRFCEEIFSFALFYHLITFIFIRFLCLLANSRPKLLAPTTQSAREKRSKPMHGALFVPLSLPKRAIHSAPYTFLSFLLFVLLFCKFHFTHKIKMVEWTGFLISRNCERDEGGSGIVAV